MICNDYEFEIIRQKTGHDEGGVLERAALLVVTKGEHGCSLIEPRRASGRAGGAAACASSIRPASATRSAAGS